MATIDVRRIYDDDLPDEGAVFLVDRIWPRGIRRDSVHLTGWLRDVAPSDELRRTATVAEISTSSHDATSSSSMLLRMPRSR